MELITQINGFFGSVNDIIWAVYRGLLFLLGGISLVVVLRHVIPAALNTGEKERPKMKGHVVAAGIVLIIVTVGLLAPTILQAAIDHFGGTGDIGLSALATSSGA